MPDPRPLPDPADAPEPSRLATAGPRATDGLAMSPVRPRAPAARPMVRPMVLGLGGPILPPTRPIAANATLVPEDFAELLADAAPVAAPEPVATEPVAAVAAPEPVASVAPVAADPQPVVAPAAEPGFAAPPRLSRIEPEPALPPASSRLDDASDWFGALGRGPVPDQRFAVPDDPDVPVVVRTRAPLWLLGLAGGSMLASGSLVATVGALFATGWLAVGRPAVVPPLELASEAAVVAPSTGPSSGLAATDRRPAPRALPTPRPRAPSALAGIGADIDVPDDLADDAPRGIVSAHPPLPRSGGEGRGEGAVGVPDDAPVGVPDGVPDDVPVDLPGGTEAAEPEILAVEDVAGGPPPAVVEDIDVDGAGLDPSADPPPAQLVPVPVEAPPPATIRPRALPPEPEPDAP